MSDSPDGHHESVEAFPATYGVSIGNRSMPNNRARIDGLKGMWAPSS
ncbi:MAG: hypothetical protein QF404_05855 [Planctomycetota bacterium]|jgi:hypothetical protein|nr:hypothetical protein [Planctomycetota bacterium]MDP6938550.1 hypothetical protein [Planctomycetota bacterium]